MADYFERIKSKILEAYNIASEARKKGFDPVDEVEVKLAENMAERVEGLVSAANPELVGKGMIERIHELEKKYEPLDWRVALEIAKEVALEKFCKFKSLKDAVDAGIRVGFTYITLGIVAAPLEGFVGSEIKKRRDGKEYLSVKFAGPVRGAGGTASAVSVIIADYVRVSVGLSSYDPDESEVKRYVSELNDFADRVTALQYHPTDDEVEFLVSHVPVELNGEPTEEIEVSNYKDLPRVETNRIRGGMVLVLSMIALKAPKLWKRLGKWGDEMGLEWDFLGDFLELQTKIKANLKGKDDKKDNEEKKDDNEVKTEDEVIAEMYESNILPNYAFVHDLVSGRPVFSHPMAIGGFRLRYGRGRNSGFSAASMHPATQVLVDDVIAIGTQLKVERPGKAAAMTTNTLIDGPIVLLDNGEVKQIKSFEEANLLKSRVKRILYLGDVLFNYGDYSENNSRLAPPGYVEEWWAKEVEKAMNELPKDSELIEKYSFLDEVIKDPLRNSVDVEQAFEISHDLNVPLYPKYIYFWKLISKDDFILLYQSMKKAVIKKKTVAIPNGEVKRVLERLGIEHKVNGDFIVISYPHSYAFQKTLGLKENDVEFGKSANVNDEFIDECIKKINAFHERSHEMKFKVYNQKGYDAVIGLQILKFLSEVSGVEIRDKAGTFVGTRMGRPEKAKMRVLTGRPNVLFPVGEEGGRLRSFQNALQIGKVTGDFVQYYCEHCKRKTIYPRCEVCGNKTKPIYFTDVESFEETEGAKRFQNITLDIKHYFDDAKNRFNDVVPDLIKGIRGTSNRYHVPEFLLKGFIRAKYDVTVNKDGTVRYDASELPLTHFKPKELIGSSIEKLLELGYTHDIHGNPLVSEDQIVELKPLDIVLPADIPNIVGADEYLLRVAGFVDELLVKGYGLKPYYNVKKREDLIGMVVLGLAPHTSAATPGRVIGFSHSQSLLAHPLWHAALRRDCDGDEGGLMLAMDAFLNFSKEYLPDKRGARTMDAPLVLTLNLNPTEVDDMVLGIDVLYSYPLEFYEAAMACKMPGDIKIEQIKHRIGTVKQYEDIGFTHDTDNINIGVPVSAYKTLPSMADKLNAQLDVAKKVDAVDEDNVAQLIIEKHFIKDIKGNLRKFSKQGFRCVSCNEKFRRIPLLGKCPKCGGKIIFTISEGSIKKYVGYALTLCQEYNVDPYVKQTVKIIQSQIDSIFGIPIKTQSSLTSFFGDSK